MKEKDITPEVIKLSKEIAELWRMEIYEGCWKVHRNGDGAVELPNWGLTMLSPERSREYGLLPIPSISDCLEKLRELGYYVRLEHYGIPWQICVYHRTHGSKDPVSEDLEIIRLSNDYPHELLLSALLEVLKGQQP